MVGFRLQAKNFFLTYPQCDEHKELALECIIQHFGDDLEYAVVAHENHQDGTDHLHVILSLKKKLTVNSPTWFDFITGKHGNYQTQRNPAKNLKYVTKDGDYVSVGINVPQWLSAHNNKQSTQGTLVANRIIDGATYDDILLEYPGYAMSNKQKIESLVQFVQQRNFRSSNVSFFDPPFQLKQWQKTALDRLLSQNDRKILWVWEPIGSRGKTTLARYLQSKHGAFLCPNGRSENVAHAFQCQEVVAIDYTRDYEGFINYSMLESFKNGYIFSPKYDSQVKFFKPCKVICFANFAPDMSKMSLDRWDIMEIDQPVTCHIRDI